MPSTTTPSRAPGRSPRPASLRLLTVLALGLVVHAVGCATSVVLTMPGPTADENVSVDMKRGRVEETLNESPTSMFENQGLTEVRYEYSDGPPTSAKLRALLYVAGDFPRIEDKRMDNIADWDGAAWRELLGKHYPAMALVEVSALLEPRAKVEIQALAVLP